MVNENALRHLQEALNDALASQTRFRRAGEFTLCYMGEAMLRDYLGLHRRFLRKWTVEFLGQAEDSITLRLTDTEENGFLLRLEPTPEQNDPTVTVDGEVRPLPAGATALDMAFAVAGRAAANLQAVSINGKSCPFDTALRNGDRLELKLGCSNARVDWFLWLNTDFAKRCLIECLQNQ